MARPRELNQEVLDKARTYLNEYTTSIPSRVGLALHLKIHRDTIYDWESKADKDELYASFSDILGEIDAEQEQKLFDKGLTGDFNSTITKLMLTKHGYSDKTQQELTGANGGELTIQIVRFGDKDK
jgi:hypothetical protein